MAALKRDHYRCRICGRGADNSVDLRLHVHHVRPREWGGLTELENLITLCHTCHEGLNPHYERRLEFMVAPFPGLDETEDMEGIRRYRELTRKILEIEQDSANESG
jgi:HNH endonuclease